MIEINLLPESMRKPEATPLPRFIATCVGVVLVVSLGFFLAIVHFKWIKDREEAISDKKREIARLVEFETKLQEVEGKITTVQARVDSVKTLYKHRLEWSKLLYDLKKIVTMDKEANASNNNLRYFWLSKLDYTSGRRKLMLNGYSTSLKQEDAFNLIKSFTGNVVSYRAYQRPEKEDEERLKAELKKINDDISEQRRLNPDFNVSGSRIAEKLQEVQAELAKVRDLRSGRIALVPFIDFFKPIKPDSTKFSYKKGSLSVQKTVDASENVKVLGAYEWKMELELKPPAGEDEEG